MSGSHAGFIVAAYAVTGFVFLALILRAVWDGRTQRAALAKLGDGHDGV